MKVAQTWFGPFVIALGMQVTSCMHTPSGMSYERCASSTICTVTGTASARPAEHAWMVRIDLSDGKCIAASLPERQLAQLRSSGPKTMTVTGRVFGDPSSDTEIASMEIEGRKIGLGLCGDFFVFVSDPDRPEEGQQNQPL